MIWQLHCYLNQCISATELIKFGNEVFQFEFGSHLSSIDLRIAEAILVYMHYFDLSGMPEMNVTMLIMFRRRSIHDNLLRLLFTLDKSIAIRRYPPTDLFTIQLPQNPSIDVYQQNKTDFGALKLR